MATRKTENEGSAAPFDVRETHPNPHGEQEVAEMTLKTDHSDVTSENTGQSTSTQGNRLNPSVSGTQEDPTTDSMFNLADPQTSELLRESNHEDQSRRSGLPGHHKKTARKRK